VEGGAGRVRVRAGAADSVRVTVALRSTDARRLADVCVPTARLDSARDAGELRLSIHQPRRDRCGEQWEVEVPARLAVRLEFASADLDVSGVGGGLHARVSGAGDVRAALAGGPAHVETNVGDVRVESPAERYGDVELRSGVGGVALWLLGHRVPSESRPGAGDAVRMRGRGSDSVTLRARVRDVEARLGGER